jgi:hypothetical protein
MYLNTYIINTHKNQVINNSSQYNNIVVSGINIGIKVLLKYIYRY